MKDHPNDSKIRIDTDLMLATGAITGPHRRTRPVSVTLRMRLVRALRAIVLSIRGPL